MYFDFLVPVPESKGKITYRKARDKSYVYYEIDRKYDPQKRYTNVRRVTIGKLSKEDSTMMQPNEIFMKYFPDTARPQDFGYLAVIEYLADYDVNTDPQAAASFGIES